MNLHEASAPLRGMLFRAARRIAWSVPGGRIEAFGDGNDKIGSILAINLDRQPDRWRRLLRELGRFRSSNGAPLPTMVQRLPAIDARDGREIAATADVDPLYTIGDQLFVQPDHRLAESFAADHPVRMTRQEIAVARSHIEAWKKIASGSTQHVLVLEDDVWFRRGAAKLIDRGWSAALHRRAAATEPNLLYLSYNDADGTATRTEVCDKLFKPTRGLWFLSGYVLSREGAAALLRAMPVVGPVDLWMNYRLAELGALALSRAAILQPAHGQSDNVYSVLPFLARAGTVDAGAPLVCPQQSATGLTLAWTKREDGDLAMALSMLGLRTRSFADSEAKLSAEELVAVGEIFDALVDAPLDDHALRSAIERSDTKFIIERGANLPAKFSLENFPGQRIAVVDADVRSWEPTCRLLDLAIPCEGFPSNASTVGMFCAPRFRPAPHEVESSGTEVLPMDGSPWVLPPSARWRPELPEATPINGNGSLPTEAYCPDLQTMTETFPGNLAKFTREGVFDELEGKRLELSVGSKSDVRPLRSGSLVSAHTIGYGRFEAEIKAAVGPGLVTGFFLHRDTPRQEIDIEITGDDPTRMLVNVYFNPGHDGAAIGYGYRGSPCRVDLGFDATEGFHHYAIEWTPERITWIVDGVRMHERRSWDPTPIPHLPMRLHANLWAPHSVELAGKLDWSALPVSAIVRNVSVTACRN